MIKNRKFDHLDYEFYAYDKNEKQQLPEHEFVNRPLVVGDFEYIER